MAKLTQKTFLVEKNLNDSTYVEAQFENFGIRSNIIMESDGSYITPKFEDLLFFNVLAGIEVDVTECYQMAFRSASLKGKRERILSAFCDDIEGTDYSLEFQKEIIEP
jgi:hypothetical protein